MKVLVTGATGFIGSALVECLGSMHNFQTIAACRTIPVIIPQNVVPIEIGDIGAMVDLTSALRHVDVVVHTAARVHVMSDSKVSKLDEYRRINVDGAINVAKQAAAEGVKRFIYLSSIKVNGEESLPGKPFSANDPPAPQDSYGISKYEAEEKLRALASETGLEVVIIRPPLVYGNGVKGNFKTLLRWVGGGFPLPLGAIRNQRSLIALDNIVNFILTCIVHPAAANQTFLVSDDEDLSTAELLRRVAQAMNRPVRLLPIPIKILKTCAFFLGKKSMMQRLCGNLQVDCREARKMLDWTPPVSVDEGLRRAAQNIK